MAINFPNNNVRNGDAFTPPEQPHMTYIYNAARGMWVGGQNDMSNHPAILEITSSANAVLRPDAVAVGYTGSRGDRGYTGSVGRPGYNGSIGRSGYNGSRGYGGSAGRDGVSVAIRQGANTVSSAVRTLIFTGNGVTATNDTGGTTGQTVTVNIPGGGGSNTGGGTAAARASLSVTVPNLAANTAATRELTTVKGYALYSITTSTTAWVTIYSSSAARTADSNRIITTDPLPGSGVIAEAITNSSSALTALFTPAVIGFNSDPTPTGTMYLKIVNTSSSTASVTVTVTHLPLEA
jgi:hypothetical protein